ncbi:MAG: hypothetical protein IJ112_05080 [Oscillospiraceae bacterium]|nr:hypothetical protein [Oscillospiraceae bacterium]
MTAYLLPVCFLIILLLDLAADAFALVHLWRAHRFNRHVEAVMRGSHEQPRKIRPLLTKPQFRRLAICVGILTAVMIGLVVLTFHLLQSPELFEGHEALIFALVFFSDSIGLGSISLKAAALLALFLQLKKADRYRAEYPELTTSAETPDQK